MDNISKIIINGTTYQVKDLYAERLIEELNTNKIDNASISNNELSFYADGIKKCSVDLPTGGNLTAQQREQIEASYLHSQSTHAPSNAEANVQSDWNVTDINSDAYIANKPTNVSAFVNDVNYATESYVDTAIENMGGNINISYNGTNEELTIAGSNISYNEDDEELIIV